MQKFSSNVVEKCLGIVDTVYDLFLNLKGLSQENYKRTFQRYQNSKPYQKQVRNVCLTKGN